MKKGVAVKAQYYKTGVLKGLYAYKAFRPKNGTPTHKYLGIAKLIDARNGVAEFEGSLYTIQGYRVPLKTFG